MTVVWKEFIRQGFPCLFHRLTGMYCPGCGGTRALRYLLGGHILKSIQYHPLVPYLCFAAATEGLWYVWAKCRAKAYRGSYEAKVYVGCAVILANWVLKNWALLVMGIDLLP